MANMPVNGCSGYDVARGPAEGDDATLMLKVRRPDCNCASEGPRQAARPARTKIAKALSLKYIAGLAPAIFVKGIRMPSTSHAPHALVTGGGRGIGRAIAASLAQH